MKKKVVLFNKIELMQRVQILVHRPRLLGNPTKAQPHQRHHQTLASEALHDNKTTKLPKKRTSPPLDGDKRAIMDSR